MGKGDKKTRRGKLFQGSFGVRRRRKQVAAGVPQNPTARVKEVKEVKEVKAAREPAVEKPPKAAPAAKKESKSKKTGEPAA